MVELLASLALATDCAVMVFDEPTANLDPAARSTFFQFGEASERR